MRIERFRIHNFGEFDDVELDLSALPGRMVVITGDNGTGKSTALELITGGALYRQCPTRGPLSELARPDALLEVVVHNGKRYTIRQACSGARSKKAETVILGPDGMPVLDTTKVSAADRWLADHFPPAEVLFASAFAVQARRGLFELSRAERVAMFSRALGLERYERLSKAASEAARSTADEVTTLRARIAEIAPPEMPALRTALRDAEDALGKAKLATGDARAGLARARAAAADLERARELAERRKAAEGRLRAARERKADVEERIRNNQALLDQAGEIRAAAARGAELDGEVAKAREDASSLKRSEAAAEAQLRAATDKEASAKRAAERAAERVRGLSARLADAPKVRAARAALDRWAAAGEPAASETAVRSLEREIESLEALARNAKDARIAGLRDGLGAIAGCEDADAPLQSWAAHTLATDDGLEAAEADPAASIREKRAELARARETLGKLGADIARAESLAAKLAAIAQAEADLAAANGEQAELAAALERVAGEREWARAVVSDAHAQVRAADAELSRLTAERAALAPLIARLGPLAQAETLIEERRAQLPPLLATIEEAEREISRLPAGEPDAVNIGESERRVTEAESAEGEATARVARARVALERGKEAHDKAAELRERVRDAERVFGYRKRLAADLGREGLQAMELDAAFPEMTEFANHLLHTCYGTRFTVEFVGYRLSADGKKAIEEPDVRVIDNVKGRDALAHTYSGGELVIVGEAVSLAITAAMCRRFDIESPTLIRDESGAALFLEGDAPEAWMSMLRRAAELVNADKVLIVTHVPRVAALGDVELRFGNGKITAYSPGGERLVAA